jgi:hypothetical protein
MSLVMRYAVPFVLGIFAGGWFRSEVDGSGEPEAAGTTLGKNAIWAGALAVGVWLWVRKKR